MSFFFIIMYNYNRRVCDNMSKYSLLKDKLNAEKTRLLNQRDRLSKQVEIYNKKAIIVKSIKNNKYAYSSEISKLKKYFPEYSRYYDILARVNTTIDSINNRKFNSINRVSLMVDLTDAFKLYGVDDKGKIITIDRGISSCQTANLKNKVMENIVNKIIGGNGNGILDMLTEIYNDFSEKTTELIEASLKKMEVPQEVYDEIGKIDKRIEEIDSIIAKFSYDALLSDFETDEEISDLIKKVGNLLTNDELIELLNNIKEDILSRNEEQVEKIDFSNLDLDKFNDVEKNIIEELREIIEDEDLNEENQVFTNNEVSLNARISLYEKCSVNDMLLDVKQNLLEHIYDNKEVIKIFKYIIDKYRIYSTNVIRNEKVVELLRIKSDFNTIINYIHKSYKEDTYQKIEEISLIIQAIDNTYIPVIREMIEDNIDFDEFFDVEIDKIIDSSKKTIKGWKKEMSRAYKEEIDEEDLSEDTDNLVFCLTEIDLSNGADKEFSGTVEALEYRSSQDLKKSSGRKGMTRIRKSTEHGKEKDFVEYLESKYKTKIKFVPYRYSSEPDYRTGLIKFEPSSNVKEFLENYYGLSKQSAYYGIFHVITSKGADHTEYYYLERYIIKNYEYIKELSELFASDEPDYDKLVSVLDELINKKKVLLTSIQNTMN